MGANRISSSPNIPSPENKADESCLVDGLVFDSVATSFLLVAGLTFFAVTLGVLALDVEGAGFKDVGGMANKSSSSSSKRLVTFCDVFPAATYKQIRLRIHSFI